MTIEQFEQLPGEDAVGMAPAKPGPINAVLAIIAAVLAAAFAVILILVA